MFGRRKNDRVSDSDEFEVEGSDPADVAHLTGDAADADGAAVDDDGVLDDAPDHRPGRSTGHRLEGPFDVSELHEPRVGDRIDLGGMWLPAIEGIELRMQVSQESGVVESVAAVANDSAMELRPFAAPRSSGIWEDVRTEIVAEITASGGSTEVLDGPFGPELHARVLVPLPTGATAMQPLRFIGVDGPRWFLRAVVSGAGAVEVGDDPAGIDAPLMAVLRGTIVVRGTSPMAPRDAIDLHVPPQARQGIAPGEASASSGNPASAYEENPFGRGPQIEELR